MNFTIASDESDMWRLKTRNNSCECTWCLRCSSLSPTPGMVSVCVSAQDIADKMSWLAPPMYAVKRKHQTGHSSLPTEKTFAFPSVLVSTRGLAAGAAVAAPSC
eukprot:2127882-Amphidinium_carterae.1